jgi:hypothetical protein
VFVLLDDVQFPKTGAGTWVNRAKVMIGDRPGWLTVPIRRDYHGVRRINEIAIDDSKPWRERLRKRLEGTYRKRAHFSSTMDVLTRIFSYGGTNLAEFNEQAIRAVLGHVGYRAGTIVRSSQLGRSEHGTALLIAISKAVGATTYLCGGGAAGYQDDDAFEREGVHLRYQRFTHPRYPQTNVSHFHEGLSILDALFERGPSETAALIDGGTR